MKQYIKYEIVIFLSTLRSKHPNFENIYYFINPKAQPPMAFVTSLTSFWAASGLTMPVCSDTHQGEAEESYALLGKQTAPGLLHPTYLIEHANTTRAWLLFHLGHVSELLSQIRGKATSPPRERAGLIAAGL